MDADSIHLVRVTTDDRTLQFWAAATACLLDITLNRQALSLSSI